MRAAAARALAEVLDGASLERALAPVLAGVAARDRGLCRELCAGTLRLAPRLQGLLEQLLTRPLRERDRDIQALALANRVIHQTIMLTDDALLCIYDGAGLGE